MQRRITSEELAEAIQKDRVDAKGTLERLVEAGLVEAHGSTRARSFTLASQVYATLGQQVEYTRQAGFDAIQQEQMVLRYVQDHGSVQRSIVMDLCRISSRQATRLLKRLVDKGSLVMEGSRRWARYYPPEAGYDRDGS